MIAFTVTVLFASLARVPLSLAARPVHALTPPPRILNVVRHRLKPGTARTYEKLEASIVKAYERAHVQVFWATLQSKSDAMDIVYLNMADSQEQWEQMEMRYTEAAPRHPELPKLSARLATLFDHQTRTLTTKRDDIPYGRADVDFHTMRALRLVVFHVLEGREGAFMRAAQTAEGRTAPWVIYEANAESTFMLVTPMRSLSEAKNAPAIPLRLLQLQRVYSAAETGIYVVKPAMSHAQKK